jgi:hypothetical protein
LGLAIVRKLNVSDIYVMPKGLKTPLYETGLERTVIKPDCTAKPVPHEIPRDLNVSVRFSHEVHIMNIRARPCLPVRLVRQNTGRISI